MKELLISDYCVKYHDEVFGVDPKIIINEAEADDFKFPKRLPRTHKYSYGRALIVAGATGYSGAPALAASACERSGAGLTHVTVPESIYPIVASKCDGAVVTPLKASTTGTIHSGAVNMLEPLLKTANVCAIGPGLGHDENAYELVAFVICHAACPLILDADAITVCGMDRKLLDECHAPLILTPHEGEFKRIGGDLSYGRLEGALRYTQEHPNTALVLKGFGTLICQGQEVTVNPTGSPALAKGGTGDVLCGILCGLLAQGFEHLFAARCAAFLHGLAGDLAAEEIGEYSVAPSDIIRFLPQAIRSLTQFEGGT